MGEGWRPGSNVRLTTVVLAAALGIVVAAPAASGQSPADQYIPSPKPSDSGDNERDPARERSEVTSPGSDETPTAFGPESQPPPGSGGGQADGSVGGGEGASVSGDPETGVDGTGTSDDDQIYPLSPFAIAVLGLLAVGLLVATVMAVRNRLRAG